MFLNILLITAGAVITAFLMYVALLPSAFYITRTENMNASTSSIFAQVNDFRKWQAWSPWASIDPDARVAYDGPLSGAGAKYRWSGNQQLGEGNMMIIESVPEESIRIRLEFIRPRPGISTTEFSFEPVDDDTTLVRWSMSGQNNFVTRAVCVFVNMDHIVGSLFEHGLMNLKNIVEKTV